MNLFIFIFDFLKSFKLIKKSKKGGIFRACTHGCDVALGATWLCHVDRRERLRGAQVTRGTYYMYIIYFT